MSVISATLIEDASGSDDVDEEDDEEEPQPVAMTARATARMAMNVVRAREIIGPAFPGLRTFNLAGFAAGTPAAFVPADA